MLHLTYLATFALWSNWILNCVTDVLRNLLFPSCLSDWKLVSVHVFGMKHLWDIHFLLLILLYLLGGVTSQVNPGTHVSSSILQDPTGCFQVSDLNELIFDSQEEYYKMAFCEFWVVCLGLVLQSRNPDCSGFRFWISAALWEPCGPLSLVWPLWSQHAHFSPALPPQYGWFLWCQWKRTNIYIYIFFYEEIK